MQRNEAARERIMYCERIIQIPSGGCPLSIQIIGFRETKDNKKHYVEDIVAIIKGVTLLWVYSNLDKKSFIVIARTHNYRCIVKEFKDVTFFNVLMAETYRDPFWNASVFPPIETWKKRLELPDMLSNAIILNKI